MSKPNPNAPQLIADYISKQSESDQLMLEKLRSIILSVDDRIVEDWKWDAPNFNYKGLLTWLIAFKQNVGLNFYKGVLIEDTANLFVEDEADEKGNRIIKFTSFDEIDEEKLKVYISQAVLLNEKGIQIEKKVIIIEVPDEFQEALNQNQLAKTAFDSFAPSHQRDYISWITEAKRASTRETRITKTLGLLEEGKHLHWKYER